MSDKNKLEPIDGYHRLGKYYIEDACYQGQLPCAHYVIDSETGIRKKLNGFEIYDIVKSNPEFEYMHGIKYSHFDYCPLINRDLVHSRGYSLYTDPGYYEELRADMLSKETQEVRDKRTKEWIQVLEKERALIDLRLGTTYETRMNERLQQHFLQLQQEFLQQKKPGWIENIKLWVYSFIH